MAMIATDAFSRFARQVASVRGCPSIAIIETANPVRHLDDESMVERAEAMVEQVIFALTRPAEEVAQRYRPADAKVRPPDVTRSA
ncbi:hypothetical protein ACFLTY_03130 [Chloroflexota bacterium]